MSALEQSLVEPAIEVVAKATRRRVTGEYKRKIVREADACKTLGAVGAVLRRGGHCSSPPPTRGGARGGRGEPGGPKECGPARRIGAPRGQKRAAPARGS